MPKFLLFYFINELNYIPAKNYIEELRHFVTNSFSF